MPQHHRSVAFSNKKKKEQLKAKRLNKKLISQPVLEGNVESTNRFHSSSGVFEYFPEEEEINASHSKKSRYNLKFRKDNKSKSTSHHYVPISNMSEEELEKDHTYFYPIGLDYPRRPPWHQKMDKNLLDRNENKYFRLFSKDMDEKFAEKELSLYELNLETWRQLWRVTEMADILLIIVDARFPVVHFPPYLYEHLAERENKGVILIMNKCDLLPPSLVIAWQDYFKEIFPKIIVVPFSSLEGKELKKTNFKMAAKGALRLVEACEKLIDNGVDLSTWKEKIEEEKDSSSDEKCIISAQHEPESDFPQIRSTFKDGILTIGTIGYPNVGKSSLINALMGKKVVSVSKTPGHTKHFQTIFITKNVKLCDCPGLVFPSLCPKQLQVITGSYPIAHVRDPLSSIAYIASRIDIPKILKLNMYQKDVMTDDFQWTPFYICEAWAKKRGYLTRTKGGKPDINRAANEILRYTLVGFKSLILTLKPPGFSENKEKYILDPRIEEIEKIQGVHAKAEERELSYQATGHQVDDESEESIPEELSVDDDSHSEDESQSGSSNNSEYGEDENQASNRFALLDVDE